MARQTFDKIESFCVVDKNPIPVDRLKRRAVTCSKTCSKIRTAQLMAVMEQMECKYCRRPSTPEERQAYKRFRRLEIEHPDLIYPVNPTDSRRAIDALKTIFNEDGVVWVGDVIKAIEPGWKSRWDLREELDAQELAEIREQEESQDEPA